MCVCVARGSNDRAHRADCSLPFVRPLQVYSILFVQLLMTTILSIALQHPSAIAYTRANHWTLYVPMVASFVTLFGTWWKRHEHPANFILLALFTACESVLIGTVTSYYESRIVCQALLITVGVFIGLTLFTMQSKVRGFRDFH